MYIYIYTLLYIIYKYILYSDGLLYQKQSNTWRYPCGKLWQSMAKSGLFAEFWAELIMERPNVRIDPWPIGRPYISDE